MLSKHSYLKFWKTYLLYFITFSFKTANLVVLLPPTTWLLTHPDARFESLIRSKNIYGTEKRL